MLPPRKIYREKCLISSFTQLKEEIMSSCEGVPFLDSFLFVIPTKIACFLIYKFFILTHKVPLKGIEKRFNIESMNSTLMNMILNTKGTNIYSSLKASQKSEKSKAMLILSQFILKEGNCLKGIICDVKKEYSYVTFNKDINKSLSLITGIKLCNKKYFKIKTSEIEKFKDKIKQFLFNDNIEFKIV